jgi:hypothetical protein
MTNGFHRVVCESIDPDFIEYPYVVDLMLRGGKPAKDRYYFGFTGRFGREMWPFVMDRDGRTDFGEGADTAERQGHFNILDKDIFVGQLVTVTEFDSDDKKDVEWTYRIKEIVPMT